jgi:hypothetical protein
MNVLCIDAQIFNNSKHSEDLAKMCQFVNIKEIRKVKILVKEFNYDSEDENYDILDKYSSTLQLINDSVWKEMCSDCVMVGDYYFLIKDSLLQEYDFINNCKSNDFCFIKYTEENDSLGYKVVDYYNLNYYHHDTLWKHSIAKTDANGKVLLKKEYTYNKNHKYNHTSLEHDSLGYKVTDYYCDSIYKSHSVVKYDAVDSKLYYKRIDFCKNWIFSSLHLDNDSGILIKNWESLDGKLISLSMSQEYKPVFLNAHDFSVKFFEKNINMSPKPSCIKSYKTKTKHFNFDKHNRLASIETIETNDETKQILRRTILKFKYYKRKRLFGLL